MFSYDLTDELRKNLRVLTKKDKVLALNFKKKLLEIVEKNNSSIDLYKNLKSPMNNYKRIHITREFI